MKIRTIVLGVALACSTTTAFAHPTGLTFPTRGACEAAYAASSKLDRERLVGVYFDTIGAAQRTFNETFECQYDGTAKVWHIVYIGG